MSSAMAEVADAGRCELGEGPFWDPIRQELLWVDIPHGLVLTGRFGKGGLERTARLSIGGTVGAVARSADGTMIIAGSTSIIIRTPDGGMRAGPELLPPRSGRRLNDGKPDPAGRYLVGSLSLGPSEQEQLFAIERDETIRVIDDDLTLSNGLAWTSDGTRMYSVDTLRGGIFARDYDPETGESGERTAFARVAGANPDGACMDEQDHLWLAVWGNGEVRRYAPDGRIVATIAVPAPHVSSVVFAGEHLDILVITTAIEGLTPEQQHAYPDSGRIFTARPGVSGQTPVMWGGFDVGRRS